jgi:hypothetical protein
MRETIAGILVLLWLLGMISSYTIGGFIHLLLVIANWGVPILSAWRLVLAFRRPRLPAGLGITYFNAPRAGAGVFLPSFL